MTAEPTPQRDEIEELRARLEEAQETLRAIRTGGVDALVTTGSQGEQVYTLRGADESYRMMVEEMAEGAITFSPDGAILYCNERFANMVKAPLEKVIGSPLQRFIAPHEHRTLEGLVEQAREIQARRKIDLQAADGTKFPVLLSARLLKIGQTEAIVAVLSDLSDVVAAAEVKARLALIVESSDDAIASTTLDGIVQTWNAGAERLFGYTATEAMGRPFTQLIVPPDRATEITKAREVLQRGGHLTDMETVGVRKDGTLVDISVSVSPMRDADGRIAAVSGVIRDITERKRLESDLRQHQEHLEEMVNVRTGELEAANKALEGFAYSVSHDLRVPLRAVDGFSAQLLKHYQDKLDDEGVRYLNLVRENANRMAQLIEDILAFSRTQRQAVAESEIDMETLVRDVVEQLKPSFAGRILDIEIGSLQPCRGDRQLLRQVWLNLLDNAIKFTRKKPAAIIQVGAHAEGKEIDYFVKDNGAGFDMQYADKLFGVFQRLHGIEEFEGTGIGLALVKVVVSRHGGRVWAEGKVGEGATFHFALPHTEKQP